MKCTLRVITGEEEKTFSVQTGSNLRAVLLREGCSPYAPLTRKVNCGGRGLCATCGVWIENGEPAPNHWHDKLAKRFGYSRLSCQVQVVTDMTVRLDSKKKIWGKRQKRT